jgi:septum formation protein
MSRRAMLYLASRSPRRRALLRRLRRPFRVVPSAYREPLHPSGAAAGSAMRHAAGKAAGARLPRGAHGIVIGADTLLYAQGRLLGKPRDLAQARRWLQALSGRPHWVYTGLCLRDSATGRSRVSWTRSRVTVKPLSEATVRWLLRTQRPLDKAGGYALQGERGRLIARVEGSRSNVIGLPLERLRRELARWERRRG